MISMLHNVRSATVVSRLSSRRGVCCLLSSHRPVLDKTAAGGHEQKNELNQSRKDSGALACCFHASANRFQAVNRRRRRGPAGVLDRTQSTPSQKHEDDEEPSSIKDREDVEQALSTRMEPNEFQTQAIHLISRIHASLTALQSINRDMVLSRGRNELQHTATATASSNDGDDDDEKEDESNMTSSVGDYVHIDLGPVHGQYKIQADEMEQMIVVMSPISGQKLYRYDHRSHLTTKSDDPSRWININDGHILEGLLVRDLIRQIQGVPNL